MGQNSPVGNIISRIINPVFIGGHRHLSHSIIGFGIFTGLFYLLISHIPLIHNPASPAGGSNFIILAFVAGYISHLFADMLTESGVPLLFPFEYHFGIPPAPFEKIRIKTGHWFENFIIYPAVNIAIIVAVYFYITAK